MATDGTEENGNWKKRESFGSAMIQIIVVGALLTGTVFLVYKRGSNKKEIAELMTQARVTALKGNAADVKKALTIADEALAKDANAPDVNAFQAAMYTDLWLIHKEAGAEAKAKDFLEKAKKADAQTEDRYGTEALHLIAAGNNKGADEFVEDLRKKGGSGARIFFAQATAQRNQGNLKLAGTGFKAAMDKAWKDLNYADAWGEELLNEGASGAIDTFSKANTQNPDHIRSRLGLALARVQKKDRVGDAENILKELMGREGDLTGPQKARATAIGAAILNIQEQYDTAIVAADKAIALNPDDPWALHAKANALALKKDPGAAAAYDAVVAKAPSSPVFYFEGAANLQKAGQLEAGMALLAKYESFFKNVKNPTADGKEEIYLDRDDRYWLARGELLRNAGKQDEAMAAFDKAIAAKSLSLTKAYYAKAALLLEKKEYDKSAELLMDITPPDGTGQLAEAYMAMGEILFQKKEWGPGCQNYAFALTRLKATQAPREKLNDLLTDVEKKLKAANQKEVAKLWVEEAKPLIQ
ncbi:MAG: cellulose synthase [Archangium sp.]|nr:cellulose synthase [Archangium sp.]